MKKKKQNLQSALELAKTVRAVQEEDAGILDIDLRRAQPVKVNKSVALQMLKKLNTPKTRRVAAVAAGVIAISAVAQSVSRYQFYRSAVGKELKKQLAPLQKQIDELQASVNALRAENAALRGEPVPELAQEAKPRRKQRTKEK